MLAGFFVKAHWDSPTTIQSHSLATVSNEFIFFFWPELHFYFLFDKLLPLRKTRASSLSIGKISFLCEVVTKRTITILIYMYTWLPQKVTLRWAWQWEWCHLTFHPRPLILKKRVSIFCQWASKRDGVHLEVGSRSKWLVLTTRKWTLFLSIFLVCPIVTRSEIIPDNSNWLAVVPI